MTFPTTFADTAVQTLLSQHPRLAVWMCCSRCHGRRFRQNEVHLSATRPSFGSLSSFHSKKHSRGGSQDGFIIQLQPLPVSRAWSAACMSLFCRAGLRTTVARCANACATTTGLKKSGGWWYAVLPKKWLSISHYPIMIMSYVMRTVKNRLLASAGYQICI